MSKSSYDPTQYSPKSTTHSRKAPSKHEPVLGTITVNNDLAFAVFFQVARETQSDIDHYLQEIFDGLS